MSDSEGGGSEEGSFSSPSRATRSISRTTSLKLSAGRAAGHVKRKRIALKASTASAAAVSARAGGRADKSILRNLNSALPPLHVKHAYISKEDSEHVLGIFRTVLKCLPGDSKWVSSATKIAVDSTGIGVDTVRKIWRHFQDTSLAYETPRISTDEHSRDDQVAREWLETELPRLAAHGTMRTIKGIQLMLEKKFDESFTKYRTERLMQDLGYVYGRASVDWTLGMTSERRQRQLTLHLLMLDLAIIEVNEGSAIILFTDQTFIEYWWGTSKGDLARMYDVVIGHVEITRRWRAIAIKRGMVMKGATVSGSAPYPIVENVVCRRYVDAAIGWAQVNLVPVSPLAHCGALGTASRFQRAALMGSKHFTILYVKVMEFRTISCGNKQRTSHWPLLMSRTRKATMPNLLTTTEMSAKTQIRKLVLSPLCINVMIYLKFAWFGGRSSGG
jgi:hypothetical protein